MKLVSVLMPTYNTPYDFLETAVDSILTQTYKNIELIIVDDASTAYNDPVEIAKIIEKDSRIKYIKNTRSKGVAGALNTGVLESAGEYIVRMDSDDIAVCDRIERQVAYLEKHTEVSILAGYIKHFGASQKMAKSQVENVGIKTTLLFQSAFAHPSVCMRSSLFTEKGYLYAEHVQSEDYELWTRCASDESIQFATLPALVLNYRIHDNQVTKTRVGIMSEQGRVIRTNYLKMLDVSLTEEESDVFVRYAMLLKTDASLGRLIAVQKKVEDQLAQKPVFNHRRFKRTYRKILAKKALSHTRNGDIKQLLLFFYQVARYISVG